MAKPTLKKTDWIALRLLNLILASDPGAASLPDVRKTIDYYYAKDLDILDAFALINKESAANGTFNRPDVGLTRGIEVTWTSHDKLPDMQDINQPSLIPGTNVWLSRIG